MYNIITMKYCSNFFKCIYEIFFKKYDYDEYNWVDSFENVIVQDVYEEKPKETNLQNKILNENICAICFENINSYDSIELSGCNHKIHINCISFWLEESICKICEINKNKVL